MENRARIAIITRTKNRPIMLERAIASVAKQTMEDYIHVIVNDGGDSDTVERLVAAGGNEARTVVIHNPVSLGMEAASNAGIRSCDSEFVLIHDDDDSLHHEFLKKTLSFMEEKSSLFCGVSSWITLVKESIIGDTIVRISEQLYSDKLAVGIGEMAMYNKLVPIAFLYKRELHEQVGYYDESLPVMGDWDFFLRALEKYDIGILPEPLAYYHQRDEANGIYANTLTGAKDEHLIYYQIIKNKMLRRDMQRGTPGIGLLIQTSSMLPVFPVISAEAYVKSVAFQISINKPESVAIYGTGNIGTQLYREISSYGINVRCFIENDENIKHTHAIFMGAPVYSLSKAIAEGYLDIAIGSWEYKNTIINRIHSGVDVRQTNLRLYCV